jgi:hypothetical protein
MDSVIFRPVEVTGLGWLGTRTNRALDLVEFYSTVLGLPLAQLGEPGPTWQAFRGPDGNVYELMIREPS